MAVVGIDLGEHTTFVSLAKMGGVDTIVNEYTQRANPSVVALGGRRRLVGVAAENQRNLTVKNTISNFKNFLGRTFKEEYVQREKDRVGADVVELEDGGVGFRVAEMIYRPEQILAALFTKVKDIVKAETGEEVTTAVVSIPLHFTETQRAAVEDAALVAGLPVIELLHDTSALALAYGKTKGEELEEDENKPRYVVLVDAGAGGLQSCLVALSRKKATVLATSSSLATGGSAFDRALLAHLVKEIEFKYKVKLEGNRKALNKLRLAVEKVKKQMSANSTRLPVTVDSLVEDKDISLVVDRALLESLVVEELAEARRTLDSLLQATTVKKEQVHSVEVVGGSCRVPAIRQAVMEVFGQNPITSINSDEGVSRGCGLAAAAKSGKFRTKPFQVVEVVSRGVEVVWCYEGQQEKLLIWDEGESGVGERGVVIRADLPMSLAVQYAEGVEVANKFISLYQVEGQEGRGVEVEMFFRLDSSGRVRLQRALAVNKEANKRRRRSEFEGGEGCRVELKVSQTTSLGGLGDGMIERMMEEEKRMVEEDRAEVDRQETKNMLEEQLYKYRGSLGDEDEVVQEEAAIKQLREYFDQTEAWLYEEGEDAPQTTYESILKSFHEKVAVFQLWKSKFLQMKAREAERSRFLANQEPPQQSPNSGVRHIPILREAGGANRRLPSVPQEHTYSRQPGSSSPSDSFLDGSSRSQRLRRSQLPEDHIQGFKRSALFKDPLFGW